MARKYHSKLTAKLVPDKTPAEQINLSTMSFDDMLALFADTKQMEALGKKINGYMKQALLARMPDDEDEYDNDDFGFSREDTSGRITYDYTAMAEEMGENFMKKFRREGDDYVTCRLKRY